MYLMTEVEDKVHRIIPSKFPPISLFDWANSPEELEQIALLEGLTNDRLQAELGSIHLVTKEDWILGQGATPLMAAFTHIGHSSRFSDGSYGVYYAATSLNAAINETVYHRERFYKASNEFPCSISMRAYSAMILKPMIDIRGDSYLNYLNPDPASYPLSQELGKQIRQEGNWGLVYPSVRRLGDSCVAVFRPPAVSIPVQGSHLRYFWDGNAITEVYKENRLNFA